MNGMVSTKDRIKETALHLFLKKGYTVGINEIIRESNTSKGAFYHHFKSKNELFISTVDEFFFVDYEEIKSVIHHPGLSSREKVVRLILLAFEPFQKIKRLPLEEKVINYLSILAEYPNYDDLKNKGLTRFRKLQEAFFEILQTGQEGGSVLEKVDTGVLSTHLGMLIDGAILDAILTFDSVEKSEKACIRSVEQMFDLLETKKK